MKTLLFILLAISTLNIHGQDEQTIMSIFGRICQTDSIQNALKLNKEGQDSIYVYNFKTPDVDQFGIAEYEFKGFFINFDTGSNFLFSGTPYGNIEKLEISAKKALVIIQIEGLGDRKKQGKFEKATYSFINKKYRWMLKNIDYQ